MIGDEPDNTTRIGRLPRKLYCTAKAAIGVAVGRAMKPVGKPDAGKPHVRFDERGRETERPQRRNRARPRLYRAHTRMGMRSIMSAQGCARSNDRDLARLRLGSPWQVQLCSILKIGHANDCHLSGAEALTHSLPWTHHSGSITRRTSHGLEDTAYRRDRRRHGNQLLRLRRNLTYPTLPAPPAVDDWIRP